MAGLKVCTTTPSPKRKYFLKKRRKQEFKPVLVIPAILGQQDQEFKATMGHGANPCLKTLEMSPEIILD